MMSIKKNLNMCEIEIGLIKEKTVEILGEIHWKIKNNQKDSRLESLKIQLNAAERLYLFLIANWFELRLYKIIYENSSVAFNDDEIQQILRKRNLKCKWKESFEISTGKIFYDGREREVLEKIERLFRSEYIAVIDDIITVRNRLAHGQWEVQLNSAKNSISTPELITSDLNIMQLTELWSKLKFIAEFLESLVVYKEKDTEKFQQKIYGLIDKINNVDSRIITKKYDKYIKQLVRKIENRIKYENCRL